MPRPPAVTAKGAPVGAPAQATIGSEGGQIVSTDGVLTIVIPPGALAVPTPIDVQGITNLAPGGVRSAYRLSPEGQTFTLPAQLTFNYTDSDIAGSTLDAFGVAYQETGGRWRWLKSVAREAATHRISVSAPHFSDWSPVLGLQKIDPATASVQPNMEIELRLTDCLAQPVEGEGDDELSTLLGLCGPSQATVIWAANAGDSASGTVRQFAPGLATYHAPAQTPVNNPVAVTAETTMEGKRVVVVSNIDVGGHPTWTGFAEVQIVYIGTTPGFSNKLTTRGEVTWVWNEGMQHYVPQGSVMFDMEGTQILSGRSCTVTAHHAGPVGFQDGSLLIFDLGNGMQTYAGSGGTMNALVTQTDSCVGVTTSPSFLAWWPGGSAAVTDNGRTIKGSSTVAMGEFSQGMSFEFKRD